MFDVRAITNLSSMQAYYDGQNSRNIIWPLTLWANEIIEYLKVIAVGSIKSTSCHNTQLYRKKCLEL